MKYATMHCGKEGRLLEIHKENLMKSSSLFLLEGKGNVGVGLNVLILAERIRDRPPKA